MQENSELKALALAKKFIIDRNAEKECEEPFTISYSQGNFYWVDIPFNGASDPDVIIDPPYFTLKVDILSNKVTFDRESGL